MSPQRILVTGGAGYLGQLVGVVVTSVLQTTAGKMIFSEVQGDDGNAASGSTVRKRRERR